MNKDKITNRHIAKLLDRLKPLRIEDIAKSEIIRQMHFLKDDLTSETKGASDNGTNNRQ